MVVTSRLALCVGVIIVSCAAKPVAQDPTRPIVLAEDNAQRLFDDAIQWSRKTGLETGGCFRVFHATNKHIVVVNAVERVKWRRSHTVLLDCAVTDGQWHTHPAKESARYVGCDVSRSADQYLIDPDAALGLIVCGVGRDSTIPYSYNAVADSGFLQFMRSHPDAAAARAQESSVEDRYRCLDEPKESLSRPIIHCKL